MDKNKQKEPMNISISNIARQSLEIPEKIVLTPPIFHEYCDKIMKKSESQEIDINITENDKEILDKYLDSLRCNVKINGQKVYFDNDFIKYLDALDKQYPIRVSLYMIKKFKDYLEMIDRKMAVLIEQDEFNEIPSNEIDYLAQNSNITAIEITANNLMTLDIDKIEKLPVVLLKYKDSSRYEKDIESVKIIIEKIKELTQDIKEDDKDIDKFAKIYKRLAQNITYDYDIYDSFAKESDDVIYEDPDKTEKIRNSQNLYGLVKGATVCAGFSRILQASLDSVGIECRFLAGQTDAERDVNHAWNQVKIDNKWYNTDLTWDRGNIVKADQNFFNYNKLEWCLKSDKDFRGHTSFSKQRDIRCNESYDENELNKAFGFENSLVNSLAIYVPNFWTRLKNTIKERFFKPEYHEDYLVDTTIPDVSISKEKENKTNNTNEFPYRVSEDVMEKLNKIEKEARKQNLKQKNKEQENDKFER